ncbi:MAG: phosphomannomutase/phosphoglucomutase [Acidobacteriaceae bacterium]|nr:phosphomannomutase/phosphoglucomutase [Acidobacteriaceae bacterium]MBV9033619.1 phosphomannomutase/phosphoglucomutase [Acidobacteriaceae bacterium]MBV9307646.1 phosphomannomutase/phosphoglucomutase [Acidobacteriaceae bacterium]MBV9679868.1 phosphomannomutase/phosphoglucomutase [Acidobacteriaceae bacterium]
MLKGSIFREYDIRGIADEELLNEDVQALGRGLATYLIRHSGRVICLGRDCRLSGNRLHNALLKGLLASGCTVLDLGVVPTPVLYYAAVHFNANGAVMITGSHNPPEYNGFKTVCGAGTLHGEAIQDVYKLIQANDFETGEGSVRDTDAVTPYVDEIEKQFKFDRKVKVVFDAGNGTAGPVVHRLLKKLNVDAEELFFQMDGNFPNHHPDPTVLSNLKALKKAVREEKADLGIAFDGDSDRIGAVDENGDVVYGDMLMLIFGREILSRKPGSTFIGEVKCSQVMYDKLRELGGNPIMYKTGHSLIKDKMKQEHAELAGEMSGHMFFADGYYGYDDAIYSACRLLEILAKSGKPLSYQLKGIPKLISTPELRVDCPDDVKFKVMAKVSEIIKRKHQIVDVDGVRVPFKDGWGLVRASNTQPVLVMRFEASSPELLQQYQQEIESNVEEAKREVGAVSQSERS